MTRCARKSTFKVNVRNNRCGSSSTLPGSLSWESREAANCGQPGLGTPTAVDYLEVRWANCLNLPPPLEGGADFGLSQPTGARPSGVLVERQEVKIPIGPQDSMKTGHQASPICIREDVQQATVDHGVEGLLQAEQIQRAAYHEACYHTAGLRLRPGLGDGHR